MADRCVSAIKACRLRLVRQDNCGRPVVGLKSVITSKGFVSVVAAAEIEEGEEFLQKNACGEPIINETDDDFLKRYNLAIEFCKVDPGAVELTTGQRLLLDAGGDAKGFAVNDSLPPDTSWSLELWQKIAGQDCTEGEEEWLYWAWPRIKLGTLGDFSFENGPFTFELNAKTKGVGTNTWGEDNRGPFQVLPASAALERGEHVANFITTVQPPDEVCGLQPYALPV